MLTRPVVRDVLRSPIYNPTDGKWGGATPEFDPVSLFANGEGGGHWLSNASNLWQSSDGTVAVSADNDPVGRITDQSGNDMHWLQSTVASKPSYKTNSGNPVVKGDGVDDYMTNATDVNSLLNVDFDIMLSASVSSIGTNSINGYANESLLGDASGFFAIYLRSDGTSHSVGGYHWVTSNMTVEASIPLGSAFIVNLRKQSGTIYISVDGGAETSLATSALNNGASTFQLLRQYNNAALSADASLSACTIIDRALTSSERSKLLTAHAKSQGRVL